MEAEVINMWDKKLEQSVVSINAKIADAIEMTRQARALSANSEAKLIEASLELEEFILIVERSGRGRNVNL